MHYTTSERLKRIQQHLGVEPDGVLGGQTLSALEKRLIPINSKLVSDPVIADSSDSVVHSLTLSKKGIELIVKHEISSEQYYQSKLIYPTWPGGDSGITIGIGYDLGYTSAEQFGNDWRPFLSEMDIVNLTRACGVKAIRASNLVRTLRSVTIPLPAAKHVFIHTSIPAYARKTRNVFPGVENLLADAQSALLSLVYNRGTSTQGDSRREMAAIQPLVLLKAYNDIALQISSMKRLWQGRGLEGLLLRRDDEAQLVIHSERIYQPDELVRIT